MRTAPFNAFQRIMRMWDTLHPYNAAQVMKLAGRADVQRIGDAWTKTIRGLGLGRILVRESDFSHDTNAPANDCLILVPTGSDLHDFLSDQLNTPYGQSDYCPLRPFVLDCGEHHYVGVIYQHWVADSVSIRILLHQWFLTMQNPNRTDTPELTIPNTGYWDYFGPHRAGWTIDGALGATLRLRSRFARVRQMNESSNGKLKVRTLVRELPEGMIDRLVESCRRANATVNDVCLAAVAEACHFHGATPPAPGRDELALGTIVDLRALATRDMDRIFGNFLGFITTVVRDRDVRDFPKLVQRIAVQNAMHKQSRGAQSSVLRMAGALLEAKVHPPAQWAEVYRRKMPMAGGMSNVNMNRTWARDFHPSPLLDYLRISPAGPTVPMVFTPTTLGRKFNFALTWREGLVSETQVQNLMDTFAGRIEQSADSLGRANRVI